MTTAIGYAPTTSTAAATGPSLGRLTGVELRKMADTRSGRWLLAVTALISAALVTIMLFVAEPRDLTLAGLFEPTLLPSGVLLPVLGILAVTSEWTQRTALTTFVLVPDRRRIAAAKLVAAVLLAAGSIGAGLGFAALGNIVGMVAADGAGNWRLNWAMLGAALLVQTINVVMGVAFGMLLMNSATAIVLYFLLPTVWGVLGEMIRALATPAGWLDLTVTTTALIENEMTSEGWAKLGVSVAVWVLLPLTAGLVRLLRREVV
ncbi:hypothetical protein GCM10027290_26780 [Micromonospora sonneratiae]|uniref:ABC transporter permease n=1 Tax=Micromonospora sonneratiae TaxID=1184706 RepID=A0ABW3YBC1_9ACTN